MDELDLPPDRANLFEVPTLVKAAQPTQPNILWKEEAAPCNAKLVRLHILV